MGLFTNVLAAKLSSRLMDRAQRKDAQARAVAAQEARGAAAQPAGEYIPAGQNAVTTGGGRLNGLAGRATQIYKDNPKLVGGLATLAAAALLVGMKQGRSKGL